METTAIQIARQLEVLRILVVDDDRSMRRVARALLQSLGIKEIFEAEGGRAGLDKICMHSPHIVILDWEMPDLNGPEFMRILRSPETFRLPDVPVIMLTASSERSRVVEAVEFGIHEYLLKPVSMTSLLARIVSIMVKPRPMVRRGDFYGPEPRELATYKPGLDEDANQVFLIN